MRLIRDGMCDAFLRAQKEITMIRSLVALVLAVTVASPAFAMQRPPHHKDKGGDPVPVSVQRPPHHKDKGGDPVPVTVQRPPHHKDKGGGGDPAP